MKKEKELEVTHIKAFDLPGLWFRVLKACMEKGYERPVYRGARQGARRKELDIAHIEVTNPNTKPLVPDVPKGVPPPTSVKYVNSYLEYLITPFKKAWEDYTYGERIAGQLGVPEDYGTGIDKKLKARLQEMSKIDIVEGQRFSALDINQFEIIQRFVKETPETNRLIIEIGKPEDLLLLHPPCMRLLHFKVRYGKLHLYAYFRSWDAWGGLPSNLAALQLVKEYLAREAKVEDGKIFASSLGLHVYDNEWKFANAVIKGKLESE